MAESSNLSNKTVNADILDDIVAVLNSGGVIIYPTDTIWGLGCDPFNRMAVNRIYEIKKREKNKPLILLVDSISMLKDYVMQVHPRIETLLYYHNQPLTIIYQASDLLPHYLRSAENTVAIRVIKESFCKQLIQQFAKPLISTSANLSNEDYPKSYQDIHPDILSQVDYIAKQNQTVHTQSNPSVIARFNQKGDLIFIRN